MSSSAKPAAKPYSYDDQGWRTYDLDKLDRKQCGVISDTCKSEANQERYKAIGIAVGAGLLAIGSVFAAFVVSKIVAAFFVGAGGKIGFIFASDVFNALFTMLSYGGTLVFEAVAMKRLWEVSLNTVQNHWNYAKHLDQHAVDALLRKVKLESSPAPA